MSPVTSTASRVMVLVQFVVLPSSAMVNVTHARGSSTASGAVSSQLMAESWRPLDEEPEDEDEDSYEF